MRVYPVLVVQLYGAASLHGIDEFGVGLPLSEVTRSIVPQEVDAHDVVLHDNALQFVASVESISMDIPNPAEAYLSQLCASFKGEGFNSFYN